MTDKTTEGYTALPNDIGGMLRNLCAYALSEPEPLQRYVELTHQQVLFDGVVNAIRRERGRALADMSAAGKPIEDLASQVKLTPPHVRALVKEAGLTLARPKSVARREATKSGRTVTRKALRPGESATRSITEPTRLGGAPPAAKSGGWLGGLLGPRRNAESAPASPTKTAAPAPQRSAAPAPQRNAAPAPQRNTPPTPQRNAAPAPIRTEGTAPTRIPAVDPTQKHRSAAAPPVRGAPAGMATATRTAPQAPPPSAPAQAAPPAPPRSAPPQAPSRSAPPQVPSRSVPPPAPAPKQSAPKSSRRRGPTLPETISVNRGEERTLTAAERKALGLPVPKPVAGKGRRNR
jgi:hypothetical protein